MKKRLLSLVMVFAVLFAFGATAMAVSPGYPYETGQENIPVGVEFKGRGILEEELGINSCTQKDIELSLIKTSANQYSVKWSFVGNSMVHEIEAETISEIGLYGDMACLGNVKINKYGNTFVWGDCYDFIGYDGSEVHLNFWDYLGGAIEGIDEEHVRIYGSLSPEAPSDFTGTQIINGSTISKTGEYFAVVGGSISGTFQNGTHNIKATDHNLSIFLINQLNGQTRQMTSSTINSMSVTVAGGQITKIVINGRAQTTPGGFDTYTLTINY